jgi:hypothetical protein
MQQTQHWGTVSWAVCSVCSLGCIAGSCSRAQVLHKLLSAGVVTLTAVNRQLDSMQQRTCGSKQPVGSPFSLLSGGLYTVVGSTSGQTESMGLRSAPFALLPHMTYEHCPPPSPLLPPDQLPL